MFEAAKVLVPQGFVKFTPPCPKHDILVLDNGEEKKLSKAEIASLIQLDLMKEEIVSMVRIKTQTGGITYQLPPEKRNKCHDDRNYVFVMCCWWLKTLREEEDYGDGVPMDYSAIFGSGQVEIHKASDAPWFSALNNYRHSVVKKQTSPFQGKSPFVK